MIKQYIFGEEIVLHKFKSPSDYIIHCIRIENRCSETILKGKGMEQEAQNSEEHLPLGRGRGKGMT